MAPEYEEIHEEAVRRWYRYTHSIRGQTITPQDGLEYWVYEVTKEKLSAK